MRVIGIVRWKTNDKSGNPIAGVEPMYAIDGDDWRPINAAEEFPRQGQVFWPSARDAVEQTIVFFRAEDNRGQKDAYRVVEPRPAVEVVDLRDLGGPGAVKTALTLGLRRHEVREGVALVRCASDVLVGPLKLVRKPNGLFTFEVANPDRIPCFAGTVDEDLRTLHDGRVERTILPMPLGAMSVGAPTGYVDWDDDRLIVRRALTAAVARAKRAGADPGLTTRMIDEAAESVTGDGGGAELELERFRLERARELCSEAAYVSRLASEISEALFEHPSVVESLEILRAHVRTDLEDRLRAEVEASLEASREELERLKQQVSDSHADLNRSIDEVEHARQELAEARTLAATQAADLDAEISSRICDLMERPSKLLADVAILRGFLGGGHAGGPANRSEHAGRRQLDWARASSVVNERVPLQRSLFAAFKACGLAPAQAIRLHAAVVAGVVPVVSGSGALAALISYARVVCGGRVAVVHIAPDQLRPLSLDHGDVGDAALAARSISAPSLVVFEGANRSPTEAYLTPFLQVLEALPADGGSVGITTLAADGCARPLGLRWAATAVGGAATVPLSRDLWAHAISVHVESTKRGGVSPDAPTEVELSSELMVPGDTPEGVIEEIIESFPEAKENEACLRSFAGALARFESNPQRIKAVLAESALLPLVASLQDDEQRAQSLERLQSLLGDPSDGVPLVELEQRLRWRLA